MNIEDSNVEGILILNNMSEVYRVLLLLLALGYICGALVMSGNPHNPYMVRAKVERANQRSGDESILPNVIWPMHALQKNFPPEIPDQVLWSKVPTNKIEEKPCILFCIA